MGQDGDTQGTEYNCDYHAVSRRVTGRPASFHAFQPPLSARARFHPADLSSRATRALVASFGQAQSIARTFSRGKPSARAADTGCSGSIRTLSMGMASSHVEGTIRPRIDDS